MIRNIYRSFRAIVGYAIKAKRSNYSLREKIEVFRILLSNRINSIFDKGNTEITEKIFDFRVTAYSYNTLQFLFEEIFLSDEYNFDNSDLSPKIIDCGANIGMSILYFKKKHPNCSILAFEPNPYAYKLLQKNVAQNNLTNVQLFNVGLSNINGEMDFFMENNKGTLRGSINESRGGDNKIVVKTKKLSSVLDTQKIDLIKMDIEGAESLVIDDLIKEGKISFINRHLIEYHHRIDSAKSDFSSFLKCFEDHGFDYNIRTNFSKKGAFQDIFLDTYKDENIANKKATI